MRREETWYVGAALALLLGWGVAHARVWVLPGAEAAGASAAYAECGEVLLHGYVPPRSACPSLYMPLAGVSAARLFGHPGSRGLPWREAALLAGLLCVAALCVLTGAPRSAPAAVLLLLVWPELWPSHQSYVQFFYAVFVLTAACALVWREQEPTPRRTVVFATAIGASLCFRSPLAFLPPLLAALEWTRRRRLNALILLTVPYAPLIPWALMNRGVYGQWSLFERGESLPNIVTAALGRVHFVDQEWRAQVRAEPMLQSQNLLRCLAWAFAEIARHPLRYLEGAAGRLAYVLGLRPWLFAAAAGGAWLHRAKPATRALAALCAYFLLIHCSIAVLENYMVPLWALLACLAALLVTPPAAASPAPRVTGLARAWTLFAVAALAVAGVEAQARAARYGLLARARAPGSDRALVEAAALEPEDAWLNYRSGWSRLRTGDKAGAAAAWARAVRLAPDNVLWDLHRAWAAALTGDAGPLLAWDRPVPAWSTEGQRADPALLKAHALLRAGRTDSARAQLRAAYEARIGRSHGLDPERISLEVLWDRSRELFGVLPPRDWLGLWSELRRLVPGPAAQDVARRSDPMRDAAIALQNAGAHREAAALLNELVLHSPESADLWTDKAVNETMLGSWETAAADLRRAIAADAKFWPAYLSLGAVYAKLGRARDARAVYDRALAAGSASGDDPLLAEIRRARGE